MLKGVCPKCKKVYYGWALTTPKHQRCDQCGTKLKIIGEIESKKKKKGGKNE